MKRKTVAIRAAAGVMAAVLVTMAAAGIWGSRSDSKNHKEEPAEKTEGQPNQSAASEDSQSQTSGQEQTSDQGQADAQNQAAGQGTQSGQSQTGSQQNQNSSETVSGQYQVGDIMEDGAMYTGGDVEAGLDYIREHPQMWDQIVWH